MNSYEDGGLLVIDISDDPINGDSRAYSEITYSEAEENIVVPQNSLLTQAGSFEQNTTIENLPNFSWAYDVLKPTGSYNTGRLNSGLGFDRSINNLSLFKTVGRNSEEISTKKSSNSSGELLGTDRKFLVVDPKISKKIEMGIRENDAVSVGYEVCEDAENEIYPIIDRELTGYEVDVPELLSSLYSDIDIMDRDNLFRYVGALISYGFGVEARQVLDVYAGGGSGVYREISFLVDGDQTGGDAINLYLHCDDSMRFWSVLSRPSGYDANDNELYALKRIMNELSAPLFFALAPRIAEILENSGELDALYALQDRLVSLDGHESSFGSSLDTRMIDGSIAVDPSSVFVARNDDYSVEKLVNLIDIHLLEGKFVSDQTISYTESLWPEYRQEEIGPKLGTSLVKAYISRSQNNNAVEFINENSIYMGDALEEILPFLMDSIVSVENDEDFIVPFLNLERNLLPEKLDDMLINRLSSMGVLEIFNYMDHNTEVAKTPGAVKGRAGVLAYEEIGESVISAGSSPSVLDGEMSSDSRFDGSEGGGAYILGDKSVNIDINYLSEELQVIRRFVSDLEGELHYE
ncbi:hypothetical protein [Sagittula sp. SSi028]|uniref:hypothetical protein n=1 Tax=Sagittula sp. SSi028 TaxID=3400636 RepID=UPI003AF6E2D5